MPLVSLYIYLGFLTLSVPTPWLLCVAWEGVGMDSTIINISAFEGARRLIFQHDVHLAKIFMEKGKLLKFNHKEQKS